MNNKEFILGRQANRDKTIGSLVDIGTSGFFPLFHDNWLTDSMKEIGDIDSEDKLRAKKILDRLTTHRGIDRKKTILLTLSKKDRQLFISLFFKMVENKIMDNKIIIH